MLDDLRLTDDAPAYRQITEKLRALILSGQLSPGTRIPPIKALAQKWGTNYFTVQTALTPLENEGLIERAPRLGTFVAGAKTRLSSVGIYYGATFWSSPDMTYYQTLFGMLSRQLTESYITPHLWIDSRPIGHVPKPWAPMLKMVRQREVQGVIAVMIAPQDMQWLDRLGVPLGALTYVDHPSAVNLDFRDMIHKAVRRLAERGCKTVGFITAQAQAQMKFAELFIEAAAETGLRIPEQAIVVAEESSAEGGHQAIESFLNLREVPEGLFVFPDTICNGVLLGLLKRGIRVPEDLKAIFHTNREIPFYSPLPIDRITASVEGIAKGLISQVRQQMEGKASAALRLTLELEVSESVR